MSDEYESVSLLIRIPQKQKSNKFIKFQGQSNLALIKKLFLAKFEAVFGIFFLYEKKDLEFQLYLEGLMYLDEYLISQ